ncbi:HupE/UreJ family protein [Candidimonas sp. SYP-B2681]|uniref:HupE/UreJ family protein n=1 Tax=Candidimonas sp. SYP-B2681 TaxID=2497686 RepID=UPI000F860AA7|nr:HupE/UreJ family protein [Candidimonas sp. SYP-B2681]RTZ48017.1 HupE/UreJ family protein [Candidimonas sp. SYP-B2681]
MTIYWRVLVLLVVLFAPLPSYTHEVRPAYLELRELPSGEFAVLWKTPMRGEMRLALSPVFSASVENVTPVATRTRGGAAIQTWRISTKQTLRGQALRIQGLDATMTDTLVRIEFTDGTDWLRRLTPQEPAATIPARQSQWSVATEYLKLGVEHILLGVDHLLFVLALVLIAIDWKRLLGTITAFTLSHSCTLAAATLGWVRVPVPPVEAVIALSIVFVAAEIIRGRNGREGLYARAPWIVAFIFGLLHGFGFAGALSQVGLPTGNIPMALLFFNIGVEVGQLLFIAVVLGVIWLIRRVRFRFPRWSGLIPPYAIGGVAMFWVFQRIAAF